MRPGDKTARRQKLRPDHALWHEEGACLPLRSVHGQCRACADACPVDALAVSVAAVDLAPTCTGCGRCTAACPTQALWLPELADLMAPVVPVAPAAEPARVAIECRMVPPEAHNGPTAVVPCLGALTSGHLLARSAAGIDVAVVDRGWCATCPTCPTDAHAASGPDTAASRNQTPPHPASQALEAALLWLAAVDSPRRPALVHRPLPLTLRPQVLPRAAETAAPVDRRHFFRAAVERPAGRHHTAATPMGGDGRAAYPADARQASPGREQERTALEQLAEAAGVPVPAEFYPQLHADVRCCDRRMCVALCPTAALTVVDDGAATHLQWSSERCIACGTCVRACPEAALSLSAHGGTAGTHSLATHQRARCTSCGDTFTPGAAPTAAPAPGTPAVCPNCNKSRRFMDDARRQLFGAPN